MGNEEIIITIRDRTRDVEPKEKEVVRDVPELAKIMLALGLRTSASSVREMSADEVRNIGQNFSSVYGERGMYARLLPFLNRMPSKEVFDQYVAVINTLTPRVYGELKPWNPVYMPVAPIQPEVRAGQVEVVEHTNSRQVNVETPRVLKTKYGTLAYASEKGLNYKDGITYEDRVGVDTHNNAATVVDGMGGMGNGSKAADIFTDTAMQSFADSGDWRVKAHQQAHVNMMHGNVGEGGCCYVSFKINKDVLEVAHAGDTRLILLDAQGAIVNQTEDQIEIVIDRDMKKKVYVNGPVQGTDEGYMVPDQYKLAIGYRIIAVTDGLLKYFEQQGDLETMLKESRRLAPDEAIKKLGGIAKQRMSMLPRGHGDNISMVICDIERNGG